MLRSVIKTVRRSTTGLAIMLSVYACSVGGGPEQAARDHLRIERALSAGDSAQAARVLEGVVRRSRARPEHYVRLGSLYRARNSIVGRLRAQRVLHDGLRRFPDHPGIRLEYAKTLYAQTLYPDAARIFLALLDTPPQSCEAHYYLGLNWFRKWKHVQSYTEYLARAKWHFDRVVTCDASNVDAHYKLGFAEYALDDSLATYRSCETILERWPNHAGALFLLGALALDAGDYPSALESFQLALEALTAAEQRAYTDVGLLLDDDNRETYDALADAKRLRYERGFWLERDPDPTTVMNERYVEHLYRMSLADAFFANAHPSLRGWETERGRALVKFGWPSGVGTTLEGEFLSGRMEIWQYDRSGMEFTLFFRDEFLNGNYIVPMDYRYVDAAQTLFLDEPTSDYQLPSIEVPASVDVISFRDQDVTRTFLMARVDRDSALVCLGGTAPDGFVTRVAAFDEAWMPLGYFTDTTRTEPQWEAYAPDAQWYYFTRELELQFAQHHIAISVGDVSQQLHALLQIQKNTMSFLTDSLLISDILLHAPSSDRKVYIRRSGRALPVRPGAEFRADEKIGVYFEVYNLALRAGEARYTVTYSIRPLAPPRGTIKRLVRGVKSAMRFRQGSDPVILQTVQRSVSGTPATEELVIDVGVLPPARYNLRVRVEDTHTGQSYERNRTFLRRGE